jgi:hypothetical protein
MPSTLAATLFVMAATGPCVSVALGLLYGFVQTRKAAAAARRLGHAFS